VKLLDKLHFHHSKKNRFIKKIYRHTTRRDGNTNPPPNHENNNNLDDQPDERESSNREDDGNGEEEDPDPIGKDEEDSLTVDKIMNALLKAKDENGLEKELRKIGVKFCQPDKLEHFDLIQSDTEIIQWMIDVNFFP
jgi:hypothetical protein